MRPRKRRNNAGPGPIAISVEEIRDAKCTGDDLIDYIREEIGDGSAFEQVHDFLDQLSETLDSIEDSADEVAQASEYTD